MDFTNVICPACRKQVVQPINLICSHHLCYQCASKLITLDTQSFQKKYKVGCPACKKTTITYDLRHLIISETQYDQDLFVTTKYIKEKAEVSSKQGNYFKSDDDIQSLIAKYQQSKKPVSVSKEKYQQNYSPCIIHPNNPLKYYCESDKSLLCIDCLKYHKDHYLGDIQSYQDLITSDAMKLRNDLKSRMNDIKKNIMNGNDQKKTLLHELDHLQKGLDHDFVILRTEVERKYEDLCNQIKQVYAVKLQQQNHYLETLSNTTKLISELTASPLIDFNSYLKFYSASNLKLKNLTLDFQPPAKPVGLIWSKDIEGIQEGLQRFMKLKQITLTTTHQNRHRSGNHSNIVSNPCAMIQLSRKESFAQDEILSRASLNKSKENKPLDKRFKF